MDTQPCRRCGDTDTTPAHKGTGQLCATCGAGRGLGGQR